VSYGCPSTWLGFLEVELVLRTSEDGTEDSIDLIEKREHDPLGRTFR
jgi:hypothetical protein